MGEQHILLKTDISGGQVSHLPIGRLLLDDGKIEQQDLLHALRLQTHIDAPLGDIMVAEGLVEKADVLRALAVQAGAESADLDLSPPAPEMANRLPMDIAMKHGVVPLRDSGDTLLVAASSPADFDRLLRDAATPRKTLVPVIVEEHQIQKHQNRLYGVHLAQKAVMRVAAAESCRNWGRAHAASARRAIAIAILALVVLCAALAPYWTLTAGILWAVLTLIMTTVLKSAALFVHLMPNAPQRLKQHLQTLRPARRRDKKNANLSGLVAVEANSAEAAQQITEATRSGALSLPLINAGAPRFRLPRVSILVPLLRETEIAAQLIDRLSRLTYPKSLLDVVLVLEASDTVTRETIIRTKLPDWMSVIEVPEAGNLTTKPRALNYALNFCRGSIVGVWDAEDWPEPDQIEKVVNRFRRAPRNVVCLQGILDYYNSRSNWLSRCFTIEYAMWWRIIMPGISRLGLVVPLGGTTLFFRRAVLEDLGAWDAHNVTEDADLGVRLARHGYATELLPTVTREEATSRAWPWVRQRSRWLKGFLVTYFVHMRSPRRLIKDLGVWRFMGLQTLFLASVSQFAAAPLLWTFWITLFGMTHPVALTLGDTVVWTLAGIFVFAELLNITIGLIALKKEEHRHLMPFVPTMMLYFGLGALAAYKAIWELIQRPFYWDKTQHGVSRRIDTSPRPALNQPSS